LVSGSGARSPRTVAGAATALGALWAGPSRIPIYPPPEAWKLLIESCMRAGAADCQADSAALQRVCDRFRVQVKCPPPEPVTQQYKDAASGMICSEMAGLNI